MEKIESLFIGFILSPTYRVQRYLVFILVLAILSTDLSVNQPEFGKSVAGSIATILSYNLLVIGTMLFNIQIAIPKLLMKNKLSLYLLTVTCLVIIIVVGAVGTQIIFLDILSSVKSVSKYYLFLNISSSLVIIVLMFAGSTTFILFRNWLKSNLRIAELESATLKSELKYLKDQINPHFLFNTLNNAHVLFRENKPEASTILYKLEDLLRYQINNSSGEKILLTSDITFITDYLNLEKVRRDNFYFSINISGEIENIELPPLLFIPFVENAVKHSQDSEQASHINLLFEVKGNTFHFKCENSLPAYSSPELRPGGIGLKNISRRLELLFPGKHRLDLIEEETKYIVDLQIDSIVIENI